MNRAGEPGKPGEPGELGKPGELVKVELSAQKITSQKGRQMVKTDVKTG